MYIAAGRYSKPGRTIRFRRSGRADAPIYFKKRHGGRVIVRGLISIEGDYLRFSGLRLSGHTGPVADRGGDNPKREQVKVYLSGDHVKLSGCVVSGSHWHAGIYLTGARHVLLSHNFILNNGLSRHGKLDQGIYWESGSGVIDDNVVANNAGFGIQLYPRPDGVQVTRNIVSGNGAGGIIAASDARNIRVGHNRIFANGGLSIDTQFLSGGTTNKVELVKNVVDDRLPPPSVP